MSRLNLKDLFQMALKQNLHYRESTASSLPLLLLAEYHKYKSIVLMGVFTSLERGFA